MKKVILVTGASSGMGKDAALRLIAEGHIVYGAARRVEKMKDIEAAGGKILSLDVTDHSSVEQAVKTVIDEQGRIDVLYNNAGYAVYGAVEDVSLEDARRQFDVNIFGLADITKEVLPHMRSRKSGLIINTSSMGGKMYTPLGAWYHATKHALEGWSDCLRLELKQFGIDVVIIEPGIIETEFGDVMHEPMMKRSKGSPYEPMAMAVNKGAQEAYGTEKGRSPASVISDIVVEVVTAKKPKTRYSAGKNAKPAMFVRKYLGDRIFDRVVMSMLRY